MEKTIKQRMDTLFEKLVPERGRADTVAGEIVRATCYIEDCSRNGDRFGIGYGRETANPAAIYLMLVCDDRVTQAIIRAWDTRNDTTYEKRLEEFETAVLNFLDAHTGLEAKHNIEDFWEYFDDFMYDEMENYEYEDDENL